MGLNVAALAAMKNKVDGKATEEVPRQLLVDAFKALSFPDDVQFREGVMARLGAVLWNKLYFEEK